jgi:hypothetical protein
VEFLGKYNAEAGILRAMGGEGDEMCINSELLYSGEREVY